MTEKTSLNGSVDLQAGAMRKVFSEAVEGAVELLTTEAKALRTKVGNFGDRLNRASEMPHA